MTWLHRSVVVVAPVAVAASACRGPAARPQPPRPVQMMPDQVVARLNQLLTEGNYDEVVNDLLSRRVVAAADRPALVAQLQKRRSEIIQLAQVILVRGNDLREVRRSSQSGRYTYTLSRRLAEHSPLRTLRLISEDGQWKIDGFSRKAP